MLSLEDIGTLVEEGSRLSLCQILAGNSRFAPRRAPQLTHELPGYTIAEQKTVVTQLETDSKLLRRVLDTVSEAFSSAPPTLLVARRGNTEALVKRIQQSSFFPTPIESLRVISLSSLFSLNRRLTPDSARRNYWKSYAVPNSSSTLPSPSSASPPLRLTPSNLLPFSRSPPHTTSTHPVKASSDPGGSISPKRRFGICESETPIHANSSSRKSSNCRMVTFPDFPTLRRSIGGGAMTLRSTKRKLRRMFGLFGRLDWGRKISSRARRSFKFGRWRPVESFSCIYSGTERDSQSHKSLNQIWSRLAWELRARGKDYSRMCTMRVSPRQGTHVNNVFYPQSFSREDDSTIPYEHDTDDDDENTEPISEEERLAVRRLSFAVAEFGLTRYFIFDSSFTTC